MRGRREAWRLLPLAGGWNSRSNNGEPLGGGWQSQVPAILGHDAAMTGGAGGVVFNGSRVAVGSRALLWQTGSLGLVVVVVRRWSVRSRERLCRMVVEGSRQLPIRAKHRGICAASS